MFIFFWSFFFTGQSQESTPLNDRFSKLVLPGKPNTDLLQKTIFFETGLHQLTPIRCNEEVNGNQHCRYQISVFNIPVKGFHLTAHYNSRSQETTYFIPTLIPNHTNLKSEGASLSMYEALNIAKNEIPANLYEKLQPSQNGTEAGLIYVPTDYNFKNPNWILAYEIDVYTQKPWRSERLTIDANTGNIIATENRICSFASGTTETKYHGIKPIETTATLAGFVLHDQTRGSGITTTNLNTNDYFYDGDNYWNNTNADQDEVAGDVHWGSGATFDFYNNLLGHHGLDGNGLGINSFVHLNDARAYWDGDNVFYGDGLPDNSFNRPFTYINIIAHEITHGVTQYTSDLIYDNESGGLNESISDIIGVSVENHTDPGSVDWLLGQEVSSQGDYFRNMANPKQRGMADTYNGTNWSTTNGVHKNSSIGNYWFYLLVMGGSGTNDFGYEYLVEGIGWEKAFMIAHQTWSQYLNPSSDYRDCSLFSTEVAKLNYGDCSEEMIQVHKAWAAVGLSPYEINYELFASDHYFCDVPAGVTFSSTVISPDIIWDFGDGNQSTEISPYHIYSQNGTYTVSLSIPNCLGEDAVIVENDFIVIDDQSTDCDTIILTNGLNGYETGCTGVLIDDGGPGNYWNNVYATMDIESPYATGYRINFDFFETASNDYLKVYVANGNSYDFVNEFNEQHSGEFLDVTGSKIRIIWDTGWSVTDKGFVISWECLRPEIPVAEIAVEDSLSCNGVHQLLDRSLGVPNSWTWFLGDSIISTNKNFTVTVPVGTYDVSLIACNDLGCDTAMVDNLITHSPDRDICNVISMTDDLNEISERCVGTLVDDGGIDGNYSANLNAVLEIAVPEGRGYRLDFISFYTRSDHVLQVFVDNGNGFELYDSYRGLLAPFSIEIPGTRIAFVWQTTSTNIYPGFEINWSCHTTESPIADFSGSSNVACSNLIKLYDSSLYFPNQWTWLLNGDSVSNEQHPLIYLEQPGSYDLGLITCNDFGCDTLNISDYLVYNDALEECLNITLGKYDELYSTACSGLFIDDGGLNGSYSNDVNASIEINNPEQAGYQLTFNSFYTRSEDTLFLYVENDDEFELYDTYSGSRGSFTRILDFNKIKFVWKTSPFSNRSGFYVSWNCIEEIVPIAQFWRNSFSICDSLISIEENSLGFPESWTWMLDDSIISIDREPEFTVSPGTYDLTLIACNSIGCDTSTAVDFITYDPDLFICNVVNMEDSLHQVIDFCTGSVYDDGGQYGYYGYNVNSTLEIAAPEAHSYKLEIKYCRISLDDTLKIYVDNGNGFELVVPVTGYETNKIINLSGTRIRLVWKTNDSDINQGFNLVWSCHTTEIPIANFSTTNNYVCTNAFQLKDNSQNFPNRWIWLIDGDSVSNQRNPIVDLGDPGIYDLGLIACNDYGCDTLNYIDYLTYEPSSNIGCTQITLEKNTTQFAQACNGYLYNQSWEQSLPSEGQLASLELNAPGAGGYELFFQYFEAQPSDTLFLYRDIGNGFELYDIFYDYLASNSFTLEASRLKFVWKSENLYTNTAFRILWNCLPYAPFHADFTSTTSDPCSRDLQLINQSTGFPTSYTWLLNNEIVSQEADPPLLSLAPDSYDVTLIICKESGCDTIHKPNFIIYDPTLPDCQTVIMTDSLNQVSELCAGTLISNDELVINQNGGVQSILTIEAPGALGYEIDLVSFNVGQNDGPLYIQVDAGSGFEYQNIFFNLVLPQTFSVSGSRIRFIWNGYENSIPPDFEIKWQCLIPATPIADFSNTLQNSCSNLIQLKDRSINFPDQWTWFINDTIVANEQNPVVDLGAPGIYDLGLIACNNYGCDTLNIPEYLVYNQVDSLCSTINLGNNNQFFSNACQGQFFDDGGPDANYLKNTISSLEIAPTNVIGFVIDLNYVRIHSSDQLSLYVDRGNGFEFETIYSGGIWDLSGLIYGSRLKFIFESDEIGTFDGFDIEWTCVSAAPPIADFDINPVSDCRGEYQLIDQSTILTNSWTWLLDDEIISTESDPSFEVEPGSHDVTLIACNDFGCDTSMVENGIIYNPNLEFCDFIVMTDELNLTTENCEGRFIDDGGINDNYSHYVLAGLKVATPNAQAYQVNLHFFETENLYDILKIYADQGMGFEPVAEYAGIHTGTELFVTGTRILFEFTSDNSVNRPGFEVSWHCITEPVIAPTMVKVDCENTFDFALNSPNTDQITWYFGDGDWGVGSAFTHLYDAPGSYQVAGHASNLFGDTTFTMFVEADYYPAYFSAPDQVPVTEVQQISLLAPIEDQIQSIRWKLDGIQVDTTYILNISFDQNRSYELAVEIIDWDGCVSTHTATIDAGIVGTQDLPTANIRIQPNPTKDIIRILDLQSLKTGYSLTLMNTVGQQVYYRTPSPDTDQLTIDMNHLPAGVYYLNIASPDQPYRGKRIVKIQ